MKGFITITLRIGKPISEPAQTLLIHGRYYGINGKATFLLNLLRNVQYNPYGKDVVNLFKFDTFIFYLSENGGDGFHSAGYGKLISFLCKFLLYRFSKLMRKGMIRSYVMQAFIPLSKSESHFGERMQLLNGDN